MGRYRSGQTGLAVNQMSLTSGVRIPPGPPVLFHERKTTFSSHELSFPVCGAAPAKASFRFAELFFCLKFEILLRAGKVCFMRKLLLVSLFLVGCSINGLECEEGLSISDESDGIVVVTCSYPEFEFRCDARTISKFGKDFSCSTVDGEDYKVTTDIPFSEAEETESSSSSSATPKSVQQPKAPTPIAPPPPPPLSSSSSTMPNCTQHDWDCTSWGDCDDSGKQRRDCVLINHDCYKPLSVKPTMTREHVSCIEEPPLEIEENKEPVSVPTKFDYWDSVHAEMIQQAKDYVSQGPQAQGVYGQLVSIEKEFISRYNEYVNAYNDTLMYKRYDVMKTLEEAIEKKIKEFRALPKVVF